MRVYKVNRIDPVKKQADRGLDSGHGWSPMDPPDAYSPPNLDPVPLERLHPFLRTLREEHVHFLEQLNDFEAAILSIKKSGYDRESDARLRQFFDYFDHRFIPHSRREEAALFPLLCERLLATGEHGKGGVSTTATDLMDDEHDKAIQLAAVVVNFLGLVFRLPDEKSALLVLDAAIEQARNLVELLRLHVFREDNVVFALAHQLISSTEFDLMQSRGSVAITRNPQPWMG